MADDDSGRVYRFGIAIPERECMTASHHQTGREETLMLSSNVSGKKMGKKLPDAKENPWTEYKRGEGIEKKKSSNTKRKKTADATTRGETRIRVP